MKSKGYRKMRDLQRAFATAVMRPLTDDYAMQAKWVDGRSSRKALAEFIKPNDRLSSFERVEIYNRQYWFRLLDSLYEDFPGLRTLMGDERFRDLCVAYLAKYPSDSFTLRDLGNRLEKFLKEEPKWTKSFPVLARDMVRLEWAHIEAFDGAELEPLDLDSLLDGADPSTLRLRLQPYLTFLACEYPVDDYILAVRRREEPRGEASNAVAERVPRAKSRKLKEPKPEKNYLVVHRHDRSVWYKRIEPEAYRICLALKKGMTLEVACARALGRKQPDEKFGENLRAWFSNWAALGWFSRAE